MKKILQSFLVMLLLGGYSQAYAQDDSSDYLLFEDTTQFNSLEDIIKLPYFNDKVVYVDMWGTRCGPCLQEFARAQGLKSRYKNKPVVFLYLKCPYGFDDSREWKEMIQKYHLKGIHVSMSIHFYSDNFWGKYKEKYNEDRLFEIPTYLIINRKSKIVNFDAPRPSDGRRLYKLIDKEM